MNWLMRNHRYVDNPDTIVTINGQEVYKRDIISGLKLTG